ncbi:MAG TPA: hypothetical protein DIC42_04785 [Holosporales bacterium]|nr:hypothetical protein [Holosporales bacterium]
MQDKCAKFISQLGLGLSLAAGLVASTWIVSTSYTEKNSHITVRGYAEQNIISENASWSGRIEIRQKSLEESYKELAKQMKEFASLAQENGFETQSIQWGDTHKYETYKKEVGEKGSFQTNEIEYYNLSKHVEIESTNIANIKDFSDKIDDFNRQGNSMISRGARYYYPYEKLEKLKLDLLAKATDNAYLRAVEFAKNSKSRVGKLMNAQQGVFQVVAPNSTVSSYDQYDTSAINKIVRIAVTLVYKVS